MSTHLQQMPTTCYNGKPNEDNNKNINNHYNVNNNHNNVNNNTNSIDCLYDTHVHRWCYFAKGAEVRNTGQD